MDSKEKWKQNYEEADKERYELRKELLKLREALERSCKECEHFKKRDKAIENDNTLIFEEANSKGVPKSSEDEDLSSCVRHYDTKGTTIIDPTNTKEEV